MASLRSRAAPLCWRAHLPSHARRPQRPFLTRRSLSHTGARRTGATGGSDKRPRPEDARGGSGFQWYSIPVGVGIGVVGLVQAYKISTREAGKGGGDGADRVETPQPRPRVRPEGPWQVQIMSTLPLKAISRLWGRFNELDIPYYLRVPGFRLYSYIFGVNLDEVAEPDLHTYPNLAAFFYRELKPGVRPLDPDPGALLSPADGRVLQFGRIQGGDIEQVKGVTYSVDALLGKTTPPNSRRGSSASPSRAPSPAGSRNGRDKGAAADADADLVKAHEEFARVNGISYTLPDLLTGSPEAAAAARRDGKKTKKGGRGWFGAVKDESLPASPESESEVAADLAKSDQPWYLSLTGSAGPNKTALYYAVVYLAPGDYHRFHSPCAWVAESRRHFAGELYSVSPYLVRLLPGLFTLNERVVLLGRWRHGFFSLVPVGATNVGSIRVAFDRELRTNSLTTDTAADRAAADAQARGEPYAGYAEASYEAASPLLGGHALARGEEMGGFMLGSTIVLVFEAPAGADGEDTRGWRWAVEKGQKVKVGQALGYVEE